MVLDGQYRMYARPLPNLSALTLCETIGVTKDAFAERKFALKDLINEALTAETEANNAAMDDLIKVVAAIAEAEDEPEEAGPPAKRLRPAKEMTMIYDLDDDEYTLAPVVPGVPDAAKDVEPAPPPPPPPPPPAEGKMQAKMAAEAAKVQRDTKIRTSTSEKRLVVSKTPYSLKDTQYAQELLSPDVANKLCQEDVNETYVPKTYKRAMKFGGWLWTIRTVPDNVLTGFAIATTTDTTVPSTQDRVLVLHLDVICSLRGQGKQLFQNILRWCRDVPDNPDGPPYPEYRYFELEALNTPVFEAYKAWISELGPEVPINEYLISIGSEEDAKMRRSRMKRYDNGTSDDTAYTPTMEELLALETKALRTIVRRREEDDSDLKTKAALANKIRTTFTPTRYGLKVRGALNARELALLGKDALQKMAKQRKIDSSGSLEVLANRLSYQFPDAGLIPLHIDLEGLRTSSARM